MADLKSFAQPTNTTLYTDVVDTERGFHAAHATMVHNGYASPPVGALNLDNPGGATRSLTQWNGAAYVGFNANSPGGYQATTYYLNLANCFVASNIGTGNPGFQYDTSDFMDYDRANNVWRIVIGGVARIASGFDTFFNYDQIIRHEVAGPSYNLVVNTTAPLDQKRWRTDHNPSVKSFYLINDADTTAVPYDQITRSGMAITTRRLNESSGRLLVGQGITDDGATALQTASVKAQSLTLTTQPFIKFNGSIFIGTGFGFTPQFSSGITVNGPNSSNLTVSKSGRYIISIEELTASSTNSTQTEFLFNLKKNGGFYSYLRAAFTGNTSFYRGTGQSVILDLLAGDSLSIDRTDGLAQTASLSGFVYQLS